MVVPTRRLVQTFSALLSILATFVVVAPAGATPLAANLTASNGEGTFDPTIGCPGGDGESWRYAYSGLAAPVTGPFGGTWNSTVEVHDAGGRSGAFIPAGTGRLKVEVDRGGTANLEFDGGDCASAPLALTTQADGDPLVSGTLPAHATGGSGTLRGFTGSGSVAFALELGPGADNVADVSVTGDFTVLQPHPSVVAAGALWRNVLDYLGHKILIGITVTNTGDATTSGDAYAVRLANATLSGRAPLGGLPASLGRINPGQTKSVSLIFPNAYPNTTYTLTTRLEGTDALDGSLPAVVESRPVKTPLLPVP